MPLHLFRLYSEKVMHIYPEGYNRGIQIRGSKFCNIRYAADVVLITKSEESLCKPVMRVAAASSEWDYLGM